MTYSSNTVRCFIYAVSLAVSFITFSASANTNLAFKKPTIASTSESASTGPANAVDGNNSSRWASSFSNNNWISVDLGGLYNVNRVKLNWETAYAKGYSIQFSADNSNWSTVYTTQNGDGGIDDLTVSGTARYVRMNGLARATEWGYSLWEFEVYGSVYTPTSTKISANKTATASSYEGEALAPRFILDGSTSTRWSSSFSDSNWIAIDLGTTHTITSAKLHWENAYATSYQIQTSTNGSNWTTIYSTTTGKGGAETLQLSGEGRYIRMNGVKRATEWGYSLWEVEVFGYQSVGNTNPSSASSSSVSSSSSSSVRSSSSSSSSVSSSTAVSSSSSSSSSTATGGNLVVLDWFIPSERANGNYLELNEIGGYEIRYKKLADNNFTVVRINDAAVDTYTIGRLSGTYEFYIATIDTNGVYSSFVEVRPY